MTIFGTPGGTPLNTSGFQGTTPGNTPGALQQSANSAVGLVPPNGDNRGPATILSQQSNGSVAANTYLTGAGLVAAGGRAIIESESSSGANGTQTQPYGIDTLNSDSNGGAGPGAGQANQTEGPSSGAVSPVSTQSPAQNVTYTSPAQFAG